MLIFRQFEFFFPIEKSRENKKNLIQRFSILVPSSEKCIEKLFHFIAQKKFEMTFLIIAPNGLEISSLEVTPIRFKKTLQEIE